MKENIPSGSHGLFLGAESREGPRLSVVAPCFNEAENVEEFVRRVQGVCRDELGDSYEIVLVNDGSRDRTWQMIRQAAVRTGRVVGVNLSRNFGHQAALTAGLSVAGGQRVLILDADLQDPPELLPEMMNLMDEGADIVYGQRISRQDRWLRTQASKVFYRLLKKLSEVDIPLDTGDFRLISRRVLDALDSMSEQHRFIRGMTSWVGFKQVPVHYHRSDRVKGETSYTAKRLLHFATDAITGFSVRPLRLATYTGFTLSAISAAYTIYVVISWFVRGSPVTGWASLMAAVMFLGGVQLLFMGIIGEYLGRLYMQSKQRPLFIVSDLIRPSDESKMPDI